MSCSLLKAAVDGEEGGLGRREITLHMPIDCRTTTNTTASLSFKVTQPHQIARPWCPHASPLSQWPQPTRARRGVEEDVTGRPALEEGEEQAGGRPH